MTRIIYCAALANLHIPRSRVSPALNSFYYRTETRYRRSSRGLASSFAYLWYLFKSLGIYQDNEEAGERTEGVHGTTGVVPLQVGPFVGLQELRREM